MEPENKSLLDQDSLNQAINSEHTALAAYSRAYFEFRHGPNVDEIASLMLAHSLSLNELRKISEEHGVAAPLPDENVGPFARDPRQVIFGIDAKLAMDYLATSENSLTDRYQELSQSLPLPETLLERRATMVADATESIAPQTARRSVAGESQAWARCG